MRIYGIYQVVLQYSVELVQSINQSILFNVLGGNWDSTDKKFDSVNSYTQDSLPTCKAFPKLVYLALQQASQHVCRPLFKRCRVCTRTALTSSSTMPACLAPLHRLRTSKHANTERTHSCDNPFCRVLCHVQGPGRPETCPSHQCSRHLCCHQSFPALAKIGKKKTIINMSSDAGCLTQNASFIHDNQPSDAGMALSYRASKVALNMGKADASP